MFGGIVLFAMIVALAQASLSAKLDVKLSGKYQVFRIGVEKVCYVRPLMQDEVSGSSQKPTLSVLRYDLQNLDVDELKQYLRPEIKEACEGLQIRMLVPKLPKVEVSGSVDVSGSVNIQKRCTDDQLNQLISSTFGWIYPNVPASLAGR